MRPLSGPAGSFSSLIGWSLSDVYGSKRGALAAQGEFRTMVRDRLSAFVPSAVASLTVAEAFKQLSDNFLIYVYFLLLGFTMMRAEVCVHVTDSVAGLSLKQLNYESISWENLWHKGSISILIIVKGNINWYHVVLVSSYIGV